MLVIAIIMLGLAFIAGGFGTIGALGTGALAFALGFAILGVVALASFFTTRPNYQLT